MRDPLGTVRLGSTKVIRTLNNALPNEHFLYTEAATELSQNGLLINFEFTSPRTIESPRIPFVSYPHEWCNAQFVDAADLTLTISERALQEGYELKDASAWNIIYDGCTPIFCDHLSFEKITTPHWWAFAQFFRHFIFPLSLSKYRSFNAKLAFKLSRDGIDSHLTKSLLGLRRFLTRQWMFMLSLTAELQRTTVNLFTPHQVVKKPYHQNLFSLCRWSLDGLRSIKKRSSTWIEYTEDRSHYSEVAAEEKKRIVSDWLKAIKPKWVTDLGCNTGEYSKLALKESSYGVIAVDLDHECIQDLYLSSRGLNIYPIVATLDDLHSGRGWSGIEFQGLIERLAGHADALLMLALIHHLAISSSIPYEEIAKLAHKLTKQYLIIELLDSNDDLVVLLSNQRNRDPNDFSMDKQRQAFVSLFQILEEFVVPGTNRHILLMKKYVDSNSKCNVD